MPSTEIQAGLSEHPEDEIVQSEIEGARRKKKSGKGRIIAIVVSVAVIAGVFAFALPKIANYGDVWDVVKSLSWEWIAALVAAVLLNTATYGPPWMAALPAWVLSDRPAWISVDGIGIGVGIARRSVDRFGQSATRGAGASGGLQALMNAPARTHAGSIRAQIGPRLSGKRHPRRPPTAGQDRPRRQVRTLLRVAASEPTRALRRVESGSHGAASRDRAAR